MEPKKYSNHDEAVENLEKSGKLKFFGRVGHMAEGYVYSLTDNNGKEYSLIVFEDGTVKSTEIK